MEYYTDVHRRPPHKMKIIDSVNTWPLLKCIFIALIAVGSCMIGIINPHDVLRSRRQFRHWYNQYTYQLSRIAPQNCSEEYDIYLYGTRHNTSNPTMSGAGNFSLFVQPMIECLLKNTSDYIKYQMGTSQVLLGVTPTIIALIGASSEEVCFLALIGRRRFLGLLLSAGSPSIYTERAFRYQDPDTILKEWGHQQKAGKINISGSSIHTRYRWFFVILGYLAVMASMANVGALSWELGVKSVNTVNPNTPFMPLLWSALGIAAHLAGAVIFHMRARSSKEIFSLTKKSTPRTTWEWCRDLRQQGVSTTIGRACIGCKELVHREFCWEDDEEKSKLYYTVFEETRCFRVLAWAHSVLIIFHVILGTLILSSTQFVGPKDALGVMGRYILSVIVCRVVLVYELAVLKVECVNLADEGEAVMVEEATKVEP